MTDLAFDRLPVRRAGVLLAKADGCGPAWVKTVRNPEATEWALNLVRDVPIHGRLLDRRGQPLAGVSVRVRDLIVPNLGKLDNFLNLTRTRDIFHGYGQELYWPSFVPGLTSHAVTDQQGRFRLDGLGGERMAILDFQGATIQDSSITAMTREAPDSKPEKYPDQPWRITYGAGFELRLEPGRLIVGIVRDKQTGKLSTTCGSPRRACSGSRGKGEATIPPMREGGSRSPDSRSSSRGTSSGPTLIRVAITSWPRPPSPSRATR